ncbi:hypothetical protein GBA52_007052 [Prunus armeniaca]|nr:hypothetical protein GBA52_007052 [Prunus armeniaca]
MEFNTSTPSASSPPLSISQLSSPTASFPSPNNSLQLSNLSSPNYPVKNNNSINNPTSPSPPPPPPPPPVVLSPCAACKILRRRCAEKCVLAPYFPPTEPLKFTIAHRVFGASNIIKLLQLQKHLSELQAQLAKTQAELLNMQCQQGNLIALICMDMTQSKDPILQQQQQQQQSYLDTSCFLDETNLGTAWEPLWT